MGCRANSHVRYNGQKWFVSRITSDNSQCNLVGAESANQGEYEPGVNCDFCSSPRGRIFYNGSAGILKQVYKKGTARIHLDNGEKLRSVEIADISALE